MTSPRLLSRCALAWLALVLAGGCAMAPALRAQASLASFSANLPVPAGGVTASFRIDGVASKNVLIRAGGPVLAALNVAGALADPQLTLTNATTGAVVATNDDWGLAANAAVAAAAAVQVGTLRYAEGSKDAALYATLAPGSYTARVTGASGGSGTALIGIFDVDTTRASIFGYFVITAPGSLLGGFTVAGSGSRQLLVRAAGPSLGVAGALADPTLSVFAGATNLATNNDWGGTATLTALASQVGASAFAAGSRDSALAITVNPGTFTAQVSGVGGTAGTVQMEIFDAGPINTAPTITAPPQTLQVNGGSAATFTVGAAGSLPFSYQWQRNGVPISGATNANYFIPSAIGADGGNYSVVVTNASGSTVSAAAGLTIASGRIVNLSVRTSLAASQTLSVGFYASAPKSTLIRAVGPTLSSAFGLAGTIADPKIDVYDSAGVRVDGNDDWSPSLATVFSNVGAFPLASGSKDAALQRSISGSTSMQVTGTGPGIVLVETYDASGGSAARLTNVSARNRVGTGGDILIAGFVIGDNPVRLLIRGVGPGLGAVFNLPGVLADSKLEIYTGAGAKIAENDNWDTGLTSTFASVAAFPLPNGSKDSALVITLQPGAYSAQLSGVGGVTGDAIIEVYELP